MAFYETGFLNNVARVTNGKSRSISAENPDGAKGGGAKAEPQSGDATLWVGKGWKVRPCITLPADSKTTLAEIEGPGTIRHIWITVAEVAYRNCILRMWWDDEETPSVEVPLGDFFCCGNSHRAKISSIPIAVNPSGGFNSYWPMPFKKNARIEIENQWHDKIDGFFYQVDYELDEVPNDIAYFHAQWRKSVTEIDNPDHVILDGIKGKGQYVGTYVAWTQLSNGWWGEGEFKAYIDGDTDYPTICTTGTEDYFGGAWCFGDTFTTAFLGYPFHLKDGNQPPVHGLYRWHVLDPIRFESDFRATIQALGWWPDGKFQPLRDELASVGYWYQIEPHVAFPVIPPKHLRWQR